MVDAGERADVVLESVLARSGYLDELEASDDPQDGTRLENLAELVAVAREFSDDPQAGPSADPTDVDAGVVTPGLSDFLERVALVADTDQIPDAPDDATDDGGMVTLMTLHTAKGLEFPTVFLTGLEDGVFPHSRSLDDGGELEEERRLAYVGRDPRARAPLPLPGAGPVRVGRTRPQPGVPLPRRGARRAGRLAAYRGRPGPLAASRPVASTTGFGQPTSAGRRNFSAAAARADAAAKSKPARDGALAGTRRPGRPRHVRARHRGRGRRRGGEVRRLDRLRLRGRQAAAAAVRAGGEALADRMSRPG